MSHPRAEVRAAVDEYVEVRGQIEAGDRTWIDLARFFTDDVIYIDPAWGRIEGIDEVRNFLVESMVGLDDWSFPVEFTAIEGDSVVIKWTQVLPGAKADGSRWTQSGVSTLVYAGDGKFSYEEDLLNMVHVFDDLKASRWSPSGDLDVPPAEPDRDFSGPT